LIFTVSVSDGQATTAASSTVVVAASTGTGGQCDNLWDATIPYPNPGTQVVWEGYVWENKWYANIGENPLNSGEWGVWKQVGIADCSAQ